MTLKSRQDLNTNLCDAAEKGEVGRVADLLQRGADIDGRHCLDGCKQTPLMKAAGHGQTGAVQLLLDMGADVRLRDSKGQTAEDMAREKKHHEAAALLCGEGKNPDRVIFYMPIGDRTREDVYDFTVLERVTMVRQGKYGAIDAMTITGFSQIEDKSDNSQLRKAFNEHLKRGGKADEALVFPNKLPKFRLPRME